MTATGGPGVPPARIFGLILAGGSGRRLGGVEKALLVVGGQTLLARSVARLSPQVERLALSANGDPALYGFDGPILPDEGGERLGPMAGLLVGLDWAATNGASHLVTVSVDTPFVPTDLVRRLMAAGAPAQARSEGRIHPTCAIWPVDVRANLRAALQAGDRRIGHWATAQGAVPVDFKGAEPDPFFNLNEPADLARAEAWAQGRA